MFQPDIVPISFLVLAVASYIGLHFSRNRAATLVLQEFSIAVEPESMPHPTVEIVGRRQGVVAFLLSLMGFSPITRFTIAGTELCCVSTSLLGQKSQFISLNRVSTMAAGVHKPISDIIWAICVLLLGTSMSMRAESFVQLAVFLVGTLAIFGLLVVKYFLSKKFFIEVHPQGGPPISLLFKPNVIEGVPIEVDQALKVVAVIRDKVLQEGAAYRALPVSTPTLTKEPPPVPSVSQLPNQANAPGVSNEQQAQALFLQAKQAAQKGQHEVVISTLRNIIHKFPGTHTAEQARRNLERKGISV